MNRRIVYKEEAKCNFCYNWFQVFSQVKFGLNICQGCIYKALNTSCFKLPTPQGHLYQVYLAQRNVSLNPSHQFSLLQKLDQFMHTQIRQLLQKWEQIIKILRNYKSYQSQQEDQKKLQSLLKNDAKIFSLHSLQSIQKITQQYRNYQRPDPKNQCTPMKQKNINMSVKYLNKSHKKNLPRDNSKKSLKSYRQNVDKSICKGSTEQQNFTIQGNKRIDCSPSVCNIKRTGSSRGLNYSQSKQNRQFMIKMQNIKGSISSYLQQREDLLKAEPLNIMKQKIYQAIQNTNCINKCIQLVSFNGLQGIDMKCYLSNLEWDNVQVVKFVKVGLLDEQLEQILDFIKTKNIETLVLTSNNLTQESCKMILRADIKSIQNIYMGKNQIFSHKAKNQIKDLKNQYNFFL